MTNDGRDSYGSTDQTTPYEGQRNPPKGGVAKSAWAVALLAAFLILVGAWFLLTPQSPTETGPGNSVPKQSGTSK